MIRRFADLIDPLAPSDGPPPNRLGAFMRWVLRGTGKVLLVAVFTGLLLGISEAIAAWLVGYVIDLAVAEGTEGFFREHSRLLLGVAAFFLILRPGVVLLSNSLNTVGLTPNIATLAMSRLNRHTMGQSMRFFGNDFAGRIAQKQMQTVSAIGSILSEVVNSMAYALSVLVGSMLVLLQVSPRLGLILLVWFVIYAFYIRFFLPRVRKRAAARAGARAALSGQIVDVISNMSTVRLFASRAREERSAEGAMVHLRRVLIEFGALYVMFRFGLAIMAGILPVALIGASLWFWQQGLATPGDIAIAGLLSTRLGQMSSWISFVAMGIFTNIGEIENGMKTLSPPHDLRDPEHPERIGEVQGAIRFDDVSFTYDGTSAGLDGFALDIRPGERLGLVGPSGAGKSTALALLLRLYDVEEGSISVDGHDVRAVAQEELRNAIAMVRQDTDMFNRSARDNIAYGRDGASEEEIVEAARRAQADAFIRDLADGQGRTGYDAHLGERGVKLSGGQRQRIAIARAVLKDAPILLLDEATSALDSETEADVQASLEDLMTGRTVIAIAHRLSTIARMDRIVVMDGGRIVEQGTHSELIALGGLYARSWARQSGGFMAFQAEAEAEAEAV